MAHSLLEALLVFGERPFIGSERDQRLARFYYSHTERKGEPWLVFLSAYDAAEFQQFHFPKKLMSFQAAQDLVDFFTRLAGNASPDALVPESAERPRGKVARTARFENTRPWARPSLGDAGHL